MSDRAFMFVICSIATVMLCALAIWWAVQVYGECRAEGHSVMYCWSLVSR